MRRSSGSSVVPHLWARTWRPRSRSARCTSRPIPVRRSPPPMRPPGSRSCATSSRPRRRAPEVMVTDTHRAIEAVWRIESAKLVAGLARVVRDIGLAEELAQDALVAALEQWPESGVPDNPGAWLMATGKHRAIDRIRRAKLLERKHEELAAQQETTVPDLDAAIEDEDMGDDLLRLMFTACHPVLSPEARVALTLRLVGGLTTDEIARAYLAPEATVAQRIVRAKRTLAEAHVPFEVPTGAERAARLSSVLEVLYLIFNEGYSATAGDDLMRPALCEEALRLGRILSELVPRQPEVHGLVALMEIQASRSAARTGPSGEPVTLLDQNRARWDWVLVGRGLAAVERGEGPRACPGPFRPAGSHRRLPRPGPHGGGDGLGADGRPLRRARPACAVTGRRAEPCGRAVDGLRSGGGSGGRRHADLRTLP